MLSFRGCDLSKLVDEIGNLKLLRYLDLSHTKIKSLPDTICLLFNLQTLLLKGCKMMTDLPSDFSKLINLCHLELPFEYGDHPYIKKMPKNIGNLNKLQSLPYFIVEEQNGSVLKELEKLNHLRGRICIEGLSNVIDPADAAMANLKDKYLEELTMDFYKRREEMNDSIVERNVSVLEALQPNSNLKRLTIKNYNGNCFPNWLSRDCHLVSLKLKSCELCSHFPPLGQFHCLKELSISHCYGIKINGEEEFYDNNNSTIHPLKVLYITNCRELKRVPPQHLPSLQQLTISNCYRSIV
jgi:Leucine-rich repeat (LRR) protein